MFDLIKDYTSNTLLIHAILLAVSIVLGILLRISILRLGKWYFANTEEGKTIKLLFKHLKGSFYTLLPLLFLVIFDASAPENLVNATFKKIAILGFTVSLSWFIIRIFYFLEELIYSQYDLDKEDNYRERKIVTQLQFTRKVAVILVVIIMLSVILLQFESLKKFGTGILASAGIASVIIGFAAQKSLANLLAGIQIAFTQPIKIEDAVFVENEWGWIEEINLTYVVIKIWDWRRLVIPITYFVEKPFQNWTRRDASLLGSIFLYTDYRLPVEELREELKRILDNEPLWTKKAWVLQVTDVKEDTMEIRALMTGKNSPQTWDLRCNVREKLIRFIANKYPEYLPTTRIKLHEQIHSKSNNNGIEKDENGKKVEA